MEGARAYPPCGCTYCEHECTAPNAGPTRVLGSAPTALTGLVHLVTDHDTSNAPVDLAVTNAALPTPEDAQAFYDAARFRYEQQERNRERYSARVRQLVIVLTGLGAGSVYLGEHLLALPPTPGWAWWALAGAALLLSVAVVAGMVDVTRLFWSANYKGLPRKMVYEQVWTEADYYHKANIRKGYDLARKTTVLRQMADGLHEIVEHNGDINERRQGYLDRCKGFTAAGGVFFFVGIIMSFVIKFSMLPELTETLMSNSNQLKPTSPQSAPKAPAPSAPNSGKQEAPSLPPPGTFRPSHVRTDTGGKND